MAFVYKDEGYLLGGMSIEGQDTANFYKFNPKTNLWTKLCNIGTSNNGNSDDNTTTITRVDGAAFVIDTTAYITCGSPYSNSTMPNLSTWAYNFSSNTWTACQSHAGQNARSLIFPVSFTVNDKCWIGTGLNGGSESPEPTDRFYQFYPDSSSQLN